MDTSQFHGLQVYQQSKKNLREMRHSESNPGTDTQARGSRGSLFPRCLSSQTPEALSGPVIATVHRGGSFITWPVKSEESVEALS